MRYGLTDAEPCYQRSQSWEVDGHEGLTKGCECKEDLGRNCHWCRYGTRTTVLTTMVQMNRLRLTKKGQQVNDDNKVFTFPNLMRIESVEGNVSTRGFEKTLAFTLAR